MGSRSANDAPHLSATVAGTFTVAEDLTVTRRGYGAMQLAGPHVFAPPADRAAAVAMLREAAKLGITHIDTSDFHGPYVNLHVGGFTNPTPGSIAEPLTSPSYSTNPRLARAKGTPVLANTVKS